MISRNRKNRVIDIHCHLNIAVERQLAAQPASHRELRFDIARYAEWLGRSDSRAAGL